MNPMHRAFATAAVVAASVSLGGCPGPDPLPDNNPPRLWLALRGSETQVQLVDHEPLPY